ncbi:MAG: hypothetical protein GF388_04245 [Candidatus Aegiribacteria sp.]|nr:hypothetical protein [Candidatus Aegiribacteria sp.]MBD3294449.1 hypothetical protein [Candidatus Fermentibacteria bacterium]
MNNVVSTAAEASSAIMPDIIGRKASELFGEWPLSESYRMVSFQTDAGTIQAAARIDSSPSIMVYYLEETGKECISLALPFIRTVPDRHIPVVSPGFVCLLGYTPWELTSSELMRSLPVEAGLSSIITLLDKNGKGHRLVVSCEANESGGRDFVFVTQPQQLSFPVRELERLSEMTVQSPDDLLAFLYDSLGLEAAVLLVRSESGYVPVSSLNVEIDTELFETSPVFNEEKLSFPIWVDLEEGDSPFQISDQCLVYPCGRMILFTPWRGDADTLQRRADALMPAVSMKYEQFRVTHGEHRLQNVLTELDLMLAGNREYKSLIKALNTASTGFSARVLAIFGPEESAEPVATSRIDRETRDLLVSDRPFEECFSDTHISILKDGYTLLAAWDENREVPYGAVDALGNMLQQKELHLTAESRSHNPDFTNLHAVLIKDMKVLWQGRSLALTHCYQFFGNTRQCDGCPLSSISASGRKSARMENHMGYIEEIYPSGKDFLVTWTRLPERDSHGVRVREAFPGGEAEYSEEGRIEQWSGWFQEAAGAGLDQISGQNAARILNRIGAPAVMSQYRRALKGHFIPEPVEFVWKGRKCFSRMKAGSSEESIHHTVLDSRRAGIPDATTLGHGTLIRSGEPASLAEFLSTACRREGWEFDISGSASEEGAPVWFTRSATTELLTDLLHVLTPICPDRWAGLETGWLEGTPGTDGVSFLPGKYHVIQFKLQGAAASERSATLKNLSVMFRGFGGWFAGGAEKNVLQAGLPAARNRFHETDCVIFSRNPEFTELCRDAADKLKSRKLVFTESLKELAELQQTSGAVVCRLDQSNIHYATALAARIPQQPLLAASGLFSGIPVTAGRVEHLQLPVDEKNLFYAIRKVVRG